MSYEEAASKLGYVADRTRVLKPDGSDAKLYLVGKGYPMFFLTTNSKWRGVYAHRLAAFQAFGVAAFTGSPQVRHLDGDRLNFDKANLAMGTQSDNELDKDPAIRRASTAKAYSRTQRFMRRAELRATADPGMKHCSRCTVQQSFAEFLPASKSLDGLSSHCRTCANTVASEYRKKRAA